MISEAVHGEVAFGCVNRNCACVDRSCARPDQGGAIKEKSRKNQISQVGKPITKPGHTKRAKRGGGYM